MERLHEIALKLIPEGFVQCSYISIHCRQHGSLRVRVDLEPSGEHPCPLCGVLCSAVLLGHGITKGLSPAFDVVCTPTQEAARIWASHNRNSKQ